MDQDLCPGPGRPREGRRRFHRSHSAGPNIRQGDYSRGLAYEAKHEFDRAIIDFSEAIRRDPEHAEAYCYRGVAYRNKGEFDKAIADFTEAINLDSVIGNLFAYDRGHAYYEKGNSTTRLPTTPGSSSWFTAAGRVTTTRLLPTTPRQSCAIRKMLNHTSIAG